MKKIEAVIVPSHLDAVRKELECRGIRSGLTIVDVWHIESEKGFRRPERGSARRLQERVKLEFMVDDSEAEKAVNVILRHAQPESDEQSGQIAVLEVNELLRVGAG
jgi:nitrogen regulatory protein PII